MSTKNIPAWHVAAWAPVPVALVDFCALVQKMEHLGTSIHLTSASEVQCGQMLYGVEYSGEMVGIAWDWGRVRKACALSDPMTLISNIQLIGPGGTMLEDGVRHLHLSSAVRAFDWQLQLERRQRNRHIVERLAA